MTRLPWASSERRRVHHGGFSQASVLLNPKAGEGQKETLADREEEMDGEGESQPEREKEAAIYLSIHQKGDTALQIC